MAASLVGRKLGMYQITALLGQGGMATVYKGYREDIDRYVAVKVLPPHPGLDQQFIERFRLEARTIARLQHPHILPLYDYGVEDDILYLVMAYIEGGSLDARIEKGRMPLGEIDRILRQVATALDYAHRQGIIHRDIKPDNILLDKEGNALLADFGIVKIAGGGDDTQPALTITGGLVGTPAYMAPEQGSGESRITNSADIYSLGVVVYEMLTGKKPYTADTPMQIVVKHITDPVPNPRDVNEDLPTAFETIIQRALAKKPENRYQTALELADDFSRAVQGTGAFAIPAVELQASANPTVSALPVSGTPTTTPDTPSTTTVQQATNPTPTQTIIVQQGTNPVLLLGGFALIAVLVVVVVVALSNRSNDVPSQPTSAASVVAPTLEPTSIAAAVTQVPSFGSVNFSSGTIVGDTVTLQVENLKPPASDEQYVAWLKNTTDDSVLKIGELTLNPLGSGVMTPYVDAEGRVLPTLYNAVAITREKKGEVGEQPAGDTIYSGLVPSEVLEAMYALYVTAPEGIALSVISSSEYSAPAGVGETAGLQASIMAEANRGQQHAGLAQLQTVGGSVGGMHTHNEHTINIFNGTLIDYDGANGPQNPGFQKGVVLYLDKIQELLVSAASAPGSTNDLQANVELARICLDNTRKWLDQVIVLEQAMLDADDTASVTEQGKDSALIATNIVKGADANGNGQVEPFEDECGLAQVETFGLLMSTLTLVEGPLPE